MKTRLPARVFAAMLIVALLILSSACGENTAIQVGQTAKSTQNALQNVLREILAGRGDASYELTGDETVDLTGVGIGGRKKIYLQGHMLTLYGVFNVTGEGVIDIGPGEGIGGAVDLSGLRFNTSAAPASLTDALPFIEIKSGVKFIEPETGGDIEIRDSDEMTAVVFKPQWQFIVDIDTNIKIPELTVKGDWPCGEQALRDAWKKLYPYYVHFLGEPGDLIQNGLTWKWDESIAPETGGFNAADNSVQMGPMPQHKEAFARGDYSELYYQMMHETAHLFVQYRNKCVKYDFGQWIWEANALVAEALTKRAIEKMENINGGTYDLYSSLGWDSVNGVMNDGLKYQRTIVDSNATAALTMLVDVMSHDSGYDFIARMNTLVREKMAEQKSEVITRQTYAKLLDTAANGRLIDGMKPSEWLFSQPVSNIDGKTGDYIVAAPVRNVFDAHGPVTVQVSVFRRYKDSRGDLAEKSLSGQPFELSLYDCKNGLVASADAALSRHVDQVEFNDLSLETGAYRICARTTIEGKTIESNNYFIFTDDETGRKLAGRDVMIFIPVDGSGALVPDTRTFSVSGGNEILYGNGCIAVSADEGQDIAMDGKTYTKPYGSRTIVLKRGS